MSGRTSLRDRLAKARAARFVDLAVPGLDGVYVRYRPVPLEVITTATDRHRKGADRALRQHYDVLVAACEGVWEVDGNKGVSPVEAPEFDGVVDVDTRELVGTLPTFKDPAFAQAIGSSDDTAWGAVKTLYATDGDVALAAAKVLEASGFAEDDQGN